MSYGKFLLQKNEIMMKSLRYHLPRIMAIELHPQSLKG
jgi:hypothetical protein